MRSRRSRPASNREVSASIQPIVVFCSPEKNHDARRSGILPQRTADFQKRQTLRYELLVGLRYTRAKRRNHFISFISLISMAGIARSFASWPTWMWWPPSRRPPALPASSTGKFK